MIINLNELNIKKKIDFENIKIIKDNDLDSRIIDLKDCYLNGYITINDLDEIVIDLQLSGIMVINDSISLEPIDYPFSLNISENLEEIKENYLDCYENAKNTLDLKRILWQNIVLEVPISYTTLTKDEKELKGNGWSLSDEDKQEPSIDPRLKKLEELLER